MTLLRNATIAALLAILAVGPAAASGVRDATQDMPATKFNADDNALMMARVDEALRASDEGRPFSWKSDKTPASGSVVPLNRLQWNGLSCRRVQISNAYGELKSQGVYKFCEKPAGQWKVVGPD